MTRGDQLVWCFLLPLSLGCLPVRFRQISCVQGPMRFRRSVGLKIRGKSDAGASVEVGVLRVSRHDAKHFV